MDSLLEGEKYRLSNGDENRYNKSVIFVKLTDSILKSIEEFMKNTGCSNPKIQFDEKGGVINFYTDSGIKKYSFSLSDIGGKENEDSNYLPNRSFECVQQNRNGSLESLGCMMMKMQIRAKEDSYENTRFKVAVAEKEQKQNCAKEIKPAGSHIGHQIKVNQPKNIAVPSNSCSIPVAKSIAPVKPKNNVGQPFNSAPALSARHDSNPSVKPVSVPSASPGSIPSFSLQKKENSKPKVPSGIQRQPLRDRIIHLLALRPYKKPEILLKIRTEGVNEKDKTNLTMVLAQVSTMKKNSYYLSDGFWSEVQDNWKFYSPVDAETVRKNKQQHFQKRSSSDIQSSSSAKNHLPNENTASLYPPCKKQRISRLNVKSKSVSSQEHNQYINPENIVKRPSFPKAGASQMHQISKRNSFIETPNKDNKINDNNQVSQSANLFSPEYSKKSIDRNSPSTQSSGYGSKSSSQSSEDSFTIRIKKDKHRYSVLPNFEGYIHDQKLKMDGAREEGSSLSSVVPSSSQESSKKDSVQKTAAQSFRQEKNKARLNQNHPISANTEYKQKADGLSYSVLPSNIGLDGDSSAGPAKPSTLYNDKKGDLKLVLTHTADKGFKIKDKKAVKPPKESFQPTHEKNDQISPAESSRQLKKSHDAVQTSIVNSSMMHKHPKFKLQPNKPCTTEPSLLLSNQDVVSQQASHALNSATDCITDDNIHSVTSGNQFEKHHCDYKRQFVKIVSQELRQKYKAVYDAEFPGANNLRMQLKEIRDNFVALEKQFHECPKGSKEHQRIEKKILEDYDVAIAFGYKEKYEKCDYLFEKLKYIKRLVEEYDEEQLGKQ
ncbi:RNA polymerase II elongation factor ELL2 [Araneus ventricosus]|uniref:RNA polymerase II elongation factor ELL2 n=1 Tax=Araneus ventricosus TaxID=182803 RepID=A0A4Y2ENK5_ARAVE|nr:RNA polymerase II elongation factor ELL2 [Araneus ventricosus]